MHYRVTETAEIYYFPRLKSRCENVFLVDKLLLSRLHSLRTNLSHILKIYLMELEFFAASYVVIIICMHWQINAFLFAIKLTFVEKLFAVFSRELMNRLIDSLIPVVRKMHLQTKRKETHKDLFSLHS